MGSFATVNLTMLRAILTQEQASSPRHLAIPLLGLAAMVLCAWLLAQLRRTRAQRDSNTQQQRLLERVHHARAQHLVSELEAARAQLREAKQALATQRKKNHELAEALRSSQRTLREQSKHHQEARNTRPAFSQGPHQVPAVPASTLALPAGALAPQKQPAASSPVAAPVSAPLAALQAELASLRRRHDDDMQALATAQQAAADYKKKVQRLQRRSEDMRRLELIDRSKVALLEDKLRGMGRQYYEAISELAVLKGEVAPMRRSKKRHRAEPKAGPRPSSPPVTQAPSFQAHEKRPTTESQPHL